MVNFLISAVNLHQTANSFIDTWNSTQLLNHPKYFTSTSFLVVLFVIKCLHLSRYYVIICLNKLHLPCCNSDVCLRFSIAFAVCNWFVYQTFHRVFGSICAPTLYEIARENSHISKSNIWFCIIWYYGIITAQSPLKTEEPCLISQRFHTLNKKRKPTEQMHWDKWEPKQRSKILVQKQKSRLFFIMMCVCVSFFSVLLHFGLKYV